MANRFNCILGFIFMIASIHPASSQTKWSLAQCVQYARENSLIVQQTSGNVRLAEINRLNAIESRNPSFNFATNYGFRFGRTIDPTTNAFENAALNTNGFSINSGMVLFNGNRLNNTVKRTGLELEASKKDLEQINLDLSLDVVTAYLNILLSKEALRIAENNLAFSRQQLQQIQVLVSNGARPPGDQYELESQVLLDEQNLVTVSNGLTLGLLSLTQLMQLEFFDGFDIQDMALSPEEGILAMDKNQIYERALKAQPGVLAANFRLESSIYGTKIAKSAYYPTLTIFANLNTNYSSLSRKIDRLEPVLSPSTPVLINGELSTVEFFQLSPVLINNPYVNQLNENLGVGVGVQLSVPIYDQGRIRADVNRAHVQEQISGIQQKQVQQQLRNNVERAAADAIAARASYLAAEKALRAAERAFQDSEKRYSGGAISLFEFNSIRNRYLNAQVSASRSKYDYIFRLKVLEFYSGNQLDF
jgi:outer membrane protein